MKRFLTPSLSIALLLLLVIAPVGLAQNGSGGSFGEPEPPVGEMSPRLASDVANYIPVQGKLTNASGAPLNGDYDINFRLYDVSTGGTALCSDLNSVQVTNGLFSTEIWGNCQDSIIGQQLYLGIEVEGDGEMVPRQPIYAVPYAWSLKPGAVVIGTVNSSAVLHIENLSPTGRGLRSYAMSETGVNYGIVGASKSPSGVGGYFYNNAAGGLALLVDSGSGVAIKATGTGVIQSSATSTVWISGNGLRPYHQSDSTIIDMDTVGGARVTRGATAGNKNVMLPITLPGQLYGQNVTVTGLDIFFLSDTISDGIAAVLLRRQNGVCSGPTCYATLLQYGTFHDCDDASAPSMGCSRHWDITSNNILSASSGILYLTIELQFAGAAGWVEIGGVRLTLSHQ